ncbi:MAG: lasso peptide biosynthesis PqqD family chaperone [Candidatus Latescibacteria bacterium]|jgi:hypothetical protein|nr:lasso peptide biosynthesis PqqD family chaperone [Candidatus Latescibacterota bacterium]
MTSENSLTLNTTVTASDDVVVSTLDDEIVMMSVENGAYYSLDDIGRRVWELLEKPLSVSAVCDVIVDEYDVTRSECEQDMLTWLGELTDEKLVQIVDG